MEIIKLSNGIRVGNLDIPHDLEFMDKSILPASIIDRSHDLPLLLKMKEWQKKFDMEKVEFVTMLSKTYKIFKKSGHSFKHTPFRMIKILDIERLVIKIDKIIT